MRPGSSVFAVSDRLTAIDCCTANGMTEKNAPCGCLLFLLMLQ